MFLAKEERFHAVAVENFTDAQAELDRGNEFDLILLDNSMPGMNGLEGLKTILDTRPEQRVAIISGDTTKQVAQEALELGASGFIPKSLATKSLVNAVKLMAMGEQYAPIEFMTAPEVSSNIPLAAKLTERELQALEGLTAGKSKKEIARDLDIKEPTVKLDVKKLYRMVGASNRTQAALIAREAGLF